MTTARSKLVNPDVTRWYHCITKCVRSGYLLGEINKAKPGINRKAWLDDRLKFLSKVFSISVAGYAIMNNHLHTLLRIDLDDSQQWTPQEIALRRFLLFPPHDKKRQPIKVTTEFIECKIQNTGWVEEIRKRLSSISWFMKCLKEPLARLANKEDGCKGTFFEGRFRSIAILDEQSLLTVCAYIDLNPVAAGIAKTPEESQHTSIKERIDHVVSKGRISDLRTAKRGSVAASKAAAQLEEGLWLIPIEDRRTVDSKREGMLSGFTLGNYLLLIEHTGRIVRKGKVSISSELANIFDRIGTTAQRWTHTIRRMNRGRLFGSFMASSRLKLRETAAKLGLHHIANASG